MQKVEKMQKKSKKLQLQNRPLKMLKDAQISKLLNCTKIPKKIAIFLKNPNNRGRNFPEG